VEAIGEASCLADRRRAAAAELMVLGELAQAAADGTAHRPRRDRPVLASRFVEVGSGKSRKPGPMPPATAAGGGNRALDRRPIHTGTSTWRMRGAGGISPFHFLRLFFRRARRTPTPISAALALRMPRGRSPMTTARSRYRL